jgi:diadenosine tetraphosphatase ApaH/serine/threonine PP2A family protein phosphatase
MLQRAIFMSDIHGNLPALEAVAQSLPECDAVYVAGDLCLDGPCPAEVVDFLTARNWTLIVGNTDRDIVSPPVDAKALKAARIEWTRTALGPTRLDLLAGLPRSARYLAEGTESVLVVHANPLNLDDPLAPSLPDDELERYVESVDEQIVVFGHIHLPYLRPLERHLLVDVSSVGHPKDHDRRATYTIMSWDDGIRRIEQVRVPYDIDRTCDLLRSSGVPEPEEQIDALFKASY